MNHLQLIKILKILKKLRRPKILFLCWKYAKNELFSTIFIFFFAKYKNKCLKVFSLTFLRQNLDWRKIWVPTRAGKNTWNNFLTTFPILRFYNFYLLSKTFKIYQRFLKTSTPIFKMALKNYFASISSDYGLGTENPRSLGI